MKISGKTYLYALILLLMLPARLTGQPAGTFSDRLETARKLYHGGSYFAAEQAFAELAASPEAGNQLRRSEIEAFRVLCAISLGRENAPGLIKAFSDRYPTAPEIPLIYYTLASRHFDHGRYDSALEILSRTDPASLGRSLQAEYTFKRAFCQMKGGDNAQAAAGFQKVASAEHNRYTYPSLYYLGYVNYLERNFEQAYSTFLRAAGDSRFKVMSQYYQLESKFMMGDYGYVTREGDAIYDTLEAELKPNLLRMLSQSWYALGDDARSAEYMERYRAGGASLSRKDLYLCGIIAYRAGDWKEAVETLSKVASGADSLAQNASYYIADSQLRSGNRIAALKAFRKASADSLDTFIREDALFNYAKLSFDINGDITPFRRYMEEYPDSGRDDEINGYMAAAFILDKDYEEALDALLKIRRPAFDDSANIQKAAFFSAMDRIGDGAWRKASSLLEVSQEYGDCNLPLSLLTRFWQAECDFRQGRYESARYGLKPLLSRDDFRRSDEYPAALYNMGWCCFKTGDYAEAQRCFSDYLARADENEFAFDARVRLADSYFMQNNSRDAATQYEQAWRGATSGGDLYPAWQGALSYGLLGDERHKTAILQEIVGTGAKTAYYHPALYELGRSYMQAGRDDDASECFYTLLGAGADSTHQAQALLGLAMINVNSGKYDRAESYYKKIVSEYGATGQVKDALAGLESLYQLRSAPHEFLAYLDETGLGSERSDIEREQIVFNSARRLFLREEYAAAATALQDFMGRWPSSASRSEAALMLAISLERSARKEAALDYYAIAMGDATSYQTALEARTAYAALALSLGRCEDAAGAYSLLASSADAKVRTDALAGLMRARFRNREYDAAIEAATQLSALDAGDELRREASYVIAKCLMMEGEREKALAIFDTLSARTDDDFGAEAAYLMAYDAFNCGDHEAVKRRVYTFAESGSRHQYWLARAFLTLGDSFAAAGDKEQAIATYKSILEGYNPAVKDEIAGQVKVRLSRMGVK